METIILDSIPFTLSAGNLPGLKSITGKGGYFDKVAALVDQARALGRPKAMYRPTYIDEKGEDFIVIGGTKLASRVLRVNTGEAYRVFPFAATCGRELDDWANSLDDMFDRYVADIINQTVLRSAVTALKSHLKEKYALPKISQMNPGSLENWPLSEQDQLFKILGGTSTDIGVELNSSCAMTPKMSVSGVCFPSEHSFENCQLCPRENCPGRRAPYDKGLYESRYRQAT